MGRSVGQCVFARKSVCGRKSLKFREKTKAVNETISLFFPLTEWLELSQTETGGFAFSSSSSSSEQNAVPPASNGLAVGAIGS